MKIRLLEINKCRNFLFRNHREIRRIFGRILPLRRKSRREGEISDSTTRLHVAGGKSETHRDLYVGGRIGVPLGSKALAYVKAGYSNARMEYEASDGEGGLIRGGDNGDGLRLGAGLEYRIAEKLFLKGEYRYSDYEAGVSRHQLVTGIGLRF